MESIIIEEAVVHNVPDDLREVLLSITAYRWPNDERFLNRCMIVQVFRNDVFNSVYASKLVLFFDLKVKHHSKYHY